MNTLGTQSVLTAAGGSQHPERQGPKGGQVYDRGSQSGTPRARQAPCLRYSCAWCLTLELPRLHCRSICKGSHHRRPTMLCRS
eukprot:706676-Prymnesium_polylepis.1